MRAIGIACGLSLACAAGAAMAHAFLDRAEPPVGATIAASPPALRLVFTEPIEPAFSGAALATAGGVPVPTGAASPDPQNRAVLLLPLPTLPAGRYRVSWHVVSADTHRTEGSYEFEVRR
jgi:methionine-rich copper-binding protein CopC